MGTDAWENWRAFDAGASELENILDEHHSDRAFVGSQRAFGPFVISAILRDEGDVGPALLMHAGIHAHLGAELIVGKELAPADSSAHHGGIMSDEIAALISLELGVRLRYAGTRQLSLLHDGDPHPPLHFEVSRLARPGRRGHEQIPRAMSRPASLDVLGRLPTFPRVGEVDQIELVRAARAYATALWWANEDPNRAWLDLITATEIAANCRQTRRTDSVDLLRDAWPELWNDLEGSDAELRAKVAGRVSPQMKATRRFIDFIGELSPAPPEPRPEWEELDWTEMRDHARLIYAHRSKALHAGKPFPTPMLEEPRRDPNGAIQEAPWGKTAGGASRAIWKKAEMPMFLSTFEYIVREALLRWWDELAGPDGTAHEVPQAQR
ncbi:hypothetical protein ASE38_01690 [Cellulomonas sp. Root930]|nr:hypothetical protein ASE38_01690 [Cellulomonas sp. Root930]